MSYQHPQGHPQLGATFVPGGLDDYYMPAPAPVLVSPAPQRFTPEVPEQIQNNLACLELEANEPRSSVQAPPTHSHGQQLPNTYTHSPSTSNDYMQDGQRSTNTAAPITFPPRHSSIVTNHSTSHGSQAPQAQTRDYTRVSKPQSDLPNFSPFPKLHNPPPNVPPTDDEKEAVLENARMPVLNSNDPEMQLAWAQDALAYVDAAMSHEQRISESQPARSVTPQVEHQLRVDAMNIVSFLAEQHHPKAEFMKGMWLEFGKFGQRVDKREAFRCYQRAASKGYARAEYRMGMQYEQNNDPVQALVHYTRGMEAGDSASCYRMGMMTLLGQNGQPQDYARGIQLLRQAANTADENAPQGAYVLGMLQVRELSQINVPEIYLPYDERAARTNIEKAAYLGFARAQLKMGSAYELCTLGCEFNPALSLHYNALAARQGEPEADMAISKWFLCGYDGVFPKNEELAYVYAQRAAQAGLPTAEFALGYFNEIGMYVPANLDKAREWYEKAAKAGNKDAAGRLEGLAKSRTLTKKDHEDVAISKIRSQYGSRRGGRPERFKAQGAPLPAISDGSAEQPNTPSVHAPSIYGPTTPQAVANGLPSRNSTTTPYPIDDRLPAATQPMQRPATVTPYPLADGPPQMAGRPGPSGGFFAPELRSSTVAPLDTRRTSEAFSINPNILASPTGGSRANTMGSHISSVPGGGPIPPRPYTSVDNMGVGRGRLPPQQRVVSAGPQNYRQPGGPSIERPETVPPNPDVDKPQPPRLDIGFSAPLDERRGKLHKPGNPNLQKSQPKVSDIGYVAPLQPRPQSTLQNAPSSQTPTSDHRPTAYPPRDSSINHQRPYDQPSSAHPPGARPSSRPGSSAGRPARQDSMPQPQPQPQPPPKNATQPVAKSENKPAKADARPAAAPAAPRLPGKGPKTFEDMGIPNKKEDSDCIVM